MKKIFIMLFILILCANAVFAFEDDYRQIYFNLQVPNFSYIHGIDPGEYYDNKRYTWSPYPLFRLSTALYFKNIVIPPGYYLLTPTTYQDEDYILFKEKGTVKYIIPVYKKEFTPEGFYDSHLPKPKQTLGQKVNKAVMTTIGKMSKRSQRKELPQSYVEVNDLDNKFVCVIVYYGPYMYYTLFRTVAM